MANPRTVQTAQTALTTGGQIATAASGALLFIPGIGPIAAGITALVGVAAMAVGGALDPAQAAMRAEMEAKGYPSDFAQEYAKFYDKDSGTVQGALSKATVDYLQSKAIKDALRVKALKFILMERAYKAGYAQGVATPRASPVPVPALALFGITIAALSMAVLVKARRGKRR